MKPTIEEVKKVAEECNLMDKDDATLFVEELQAFAQHYKEEGRELQKKIDALVCLQQDGVHDAIYAEAIRNNTGD